MSIETHEFKFDDVRDDDDESMIHRVIALRDANIVKTREHVQMRKLRNMYHVLQTYDNENFYVRVNSFIVTIDSFDRYIDNEYAMFKRVFVFNELRTS